VLTFLQWHADEWLAQTLRLHKSRVLALAAAVADDLRSARRLFHCRNPKISPLSCMPCLPPAHLPPII